MRAAQWLWLGLGLVMILAGVAAIVREYALWKDEIERESRRWDDWR